MQCDAKREGGRRYRAPTVREVGAKSRRPASFVNAELEFYFTPLEYSPTVQAWRILSVFVLTRMIACFVGTPRE
jgi:hypothetical protein